ncbi:MAG: cation transporting ATPase C-terminal domain-containing protein, partial [Butyricicoccus sp.]|nr:cation transporting ATPase C-terminal domain-containing protein [Butyricicoccus sp.]
RSERSIFNIGVFSNRTLNLAALASLLMVALVLFTPVSVAFGLIRLPTKLYLLALALIAVPTVVMELAKAAGLIKPQK